MFSVLTSDTRPPTAPAVLLAVSYRQAQRHLCVVVTPTYFGHRRVQPPFTRSASQSSRTNSWLTSPICRNLRTSFASYTHLCAGLVLRVVQISVPLVSEKKLMMYASTLQRQECADFARRNAKSIAFKSSQSHDSGVAFLSIRVALLPAHPNTQSNLSTSLLDLAEDIYVLRWVASISA